MLFSPEKSLNNVVLPRPAHGHPDFDIIVSKKRIASGITVVATLICVCRIRWPERIKRRSGPKAVQRIADVLCVGESNPYLTTLQDIEVLTIDR
jgi:hypothetical protein